MPIHRRLPKRGFTNIFRKEYIPINIDIIQKLLDEKKLPVNKPLNNDLFLKVGLIKKNNSRVKILGNGELKDKIEIIASKFSASAKSSIEKNGGKALTEDPGSEKNIPKKNKGQ